MSKKRISTLIQLVVFLAIAGGLVWWKYNSINPSDKEEMFAAFTDIRWIWILPLFVVGFIAHLFRALRWRLIMRPIGVNPTTSNTFFAVMIGYLTNTVLPRVGEVAKCSVLAKYEKAPFEKLLGTIIAERAFDMVCLLLLFVITLLTQFRILSPMAEDIFQKIFYTANGDLKWMNILFTVFGLAFLLFLFFWIYQRIRSSKIGHFIKGILTGLRAIGKIRERGRFLVYTLMIWAGYISMAVMGFWALPEMDGLNWLAALSVISFGSIGMIITPGGIGAYPVIVAQVLVLYGVGSGVGFAYGWVSWAGQTAVVLFYGLLSLALLPLMNQEKGLKNGLETSNNKED